MQTRSVRLLVLAGFALAGCASSHNFNTDGGSSSGAGFSDEQLQPGFYQLLARTRQMPFSTFGAARRTWEARADQLCGAGAYTALEQEESSVGGMTEVDVWTKRGYSVPLLVPRVSDTLTGYVLCKSSPLSQEQARAWLREQREQQLAARRAAAEREAQALGGLGCGDESPMPSGEAYFLRGRMLMRLVRYEEARACFLQSTKVDSTPPFHAQACEALGLIYEVGFGVPKDLGAARAWYARAGL